MGQARCCAQLEGFGRLPRAVVGPNGSARPTVSVAASGPSGVAWSSSGEGLPAILVLPGWLTNLDEDWLTPGFSDLYHRLAEHHRLIRFDRPGTGAADRSHASFAIGDQVPQVVSVLDAARTDQVAILAMGSGCHVALRLAASHPNRVSQLILFRAALRYGHGVTPGAMTPRAATALADLCRSAWDLAASAIAHWVLPNGDPELLAWYAGYQQRAAEGRVAADLIEAVLRSEVERILPQVRAATLIVQRAGARTATMDDGREVAARIAGAQMQAIEGSAHLPQIGNWRRLVGLVEAFLHPASHLTNREVGVLACVEDGDSNAQIAARLGIAEGTVARHLANVFAKLNVSSRSAAVRRAHLSGQLRDR